MESERLRPLVTAKGPFVSVYFDDSRDAADAVVRVAIWRDVRKHLEEQGTDRHVVANLEEAILRGQPAVGRQGRGVIATHDRVLFNEHLFEPAVGDNASRVGVPLRAAAAVLRYTPADAIDSADSPPRSLAR